MSKGLVATASAKVRAPITNVWDALIRPEMIKQYMFGTEVSTKWKVGGPIVWKGTWNGKPYEDKGTVLNFECLERLVFTHYSPLSGLPDIPENYHTVTIELSDVDRYTEVKLKQDNNTTEEERQHSEENWNVMLGGLKKLVEK